MSANESFNEVSELVKAMQHQLEIQGADLKAQGERLDRLEGGQKRLEQSIDEMKIVMFAMLQKISAQLDSQGERLSSTEKVINQLSFDSHLHRAEIQELKSR